MYITIMLLVKVAMVSNMMVDPFCVSYSMSDLPHLLSFFFYFHGSDSSTSMEEVGGSWWKWHGSWWKRRGSAMEARGSCMEVAVTSMEVNQLPWKPVEPAVQLPWKF